MIQKIKNRIGERFLSNEGYWFTITEISDCKKYTVKFDEGFVLYNVTYSNLVRGAVRNPYHPSVFGVGYFGAGKYGSKIEDKKAREYVTWQSMLGRCYSKKNQKRNLTYKGVIVCEEWKCFQNFAEWYEKNYIEYFALDKDILFKGNKVYSAETCCFVPKEINNLFVKCDKVRGDLPIGVFNHKNRFIVRLRKNGKRVYLGLFDTPEEAFQAYKTAKEEYIKEMADKWRGQITEPCYEAMYAYEVEITD